MTRQGWVTVGIDGSEGGEAAAAWAAREARRTGAGLRLVHVFSDYVPMAGFYAAVRPSGSMPGRRLAERTVRSAAESVVQLLDGTPVEQIVLRGDRRGGLLRAAADADLMVLGDEPHPAHRHVITGSVIGPVAAHSPAPVVVVPAGSQPDPAGGIVVGVKSCDPSDGLLRQALPIAADHDARLVVLHAWRYAPEVDELIEDDDQLPEWERRSRDDLARQLDDASADVPGVDVEIRIVHGQPARVLRDASATARLLVVGRRPRGPFGHLGGTGRAVLRESRCPAMVLPPHAETVERPAPADAGTAAAGGRVSSTGT